MIVMESLSRLMDRATSREHISGFSVGTAERNSMMISHSLFVDDTLIFYNADPCQLEHLRAIFHLV